MREPFGSQRRNSRAERDEGGRAALILTLIGNVGLVVAATIGPSAGGRRASVAAATPRRKRTPEQAESGRVLLLLGLMIGIVGLVVAALIALPGGGQVVRAEGAGSSPECTNASYPGENSSPFSLDD